jgi:plastocyanin
MRRFLAIAAIGMALAVSACQVGTPETAGPGGTPRSGAAPASPATPAPKPSKPAKPARVDPRRGGLEVGFGEFAVVPEAKAIRPGKVTLVVRNGGRLTHGFEMKDDDGLESGKNDGRRLKVEGPRFDPGETYRLTVTLAPGRYELECYVANHDQLGMRATLIVRDDAPWSGRRRPRAARSPSPGSPSVRRPPRSPSATRSPGGTATPPSTR